ncbi:MAG: DUF4079 domain-containing protein [Oscillatoria sp. PMC 1068.18]|nr:DUF4079 domain-containing protein [Oscillatoria sp. PMC 1076.18]MEC4991278.1 DUF4079 domain-containing protein [Oscillatoria sp. PMC 1068.18]
MDLPSFIWLWKIAAWSMGLAIFAYLLQAISGLWMNHKRTHRQRRGSWWRQFHYWTGIIMVILVLLLLLIGIVGTLGHYGSLGHSPHLVAGLAVVALVLVSAWSATQISSSKPWAISLHITTNLILFLGFACVSLTGWTVVQKYLP